MVRAHLLRRRQYAECIASQPVEAIFGAAIAARLIGYFSVPRQPRGADAFPELTPQQVEIVARMARHESNPDIARRLSISEKTVRTTCPPSSPKLCVRDRAEAIAAAHAANLGRPPPFGT